MALLQVITLSGQHERGEVCLAAVQLEYSDWLRDNPFVSGQRGAQEGQTSGTDEEGCEVLESETLVVVLTEALHGGLVESLAEHRRAGRVHVCHSASLLLSSPLEYAKDTLIALSI